MLYDARSIEHKINVIFIVITVFLTHFGLEDHDQGENLILVILTRVQTITDFTRLSITTHAQLQRHRLKFIKNHLKNSYMFRSSTIFRELQSPR